MSFRDKINNTIQNAPIREEQSRQEVLMLETNGVCDWVRNRIELMASRHSNPDVPFEVNMCFACNFHDAFVRQEGAVERGLFQTSTQINRLTLSEEILKREKVIREQLKSDGITVGKWKLCEASISNGDDIISKPKHFGYYANGFDLYFSDAIHTSNMIDIDPYKPLTETITVNRGWNHPAYTYKYSQGGNSFTYTPPRMQLYLIMPVTFR